MKPFRFVGVLLGMETLTAPAEIVTLPKPASAVKIGRLYIKVSGLKQAVEIWNKFREESGLGASESPSVTACVDRKLYRISYNGRVWNPSTGAEVIP